MPDDANVLSVHAAYRAMFHFIDAFWERGDKRSEDLACLLSWMNINRAADESMDPAQWHDFLDAVAKTRAERAGRSPAEEDTHAWPGTTWD
jgi:hypothetical protein